jgi:hypothetical protein
LTPDHFFSLRSFYHLRHRYRRHRRIRSGSGNIFPIKLLRVKTRF